MVDPGDRVVLGCVYLIPSEASDVDVYMWVRDSHADTLTQPLFEAVRDWLGSDWPFQSINYIRTEYYLPEPDEAAGARR